MGLLDGPLRQVAGQLMGRFGTAATLRVDYHEYDPATGTTRSAPEQIAVRGLLEEYSALQSLGGSHAGAGGILAGDKKFTIAAIGVAVPPLPVKHKLEIAGVVWNIVKVDTQLATDQAALYVLQIRRG